VSVYVPEGRDAESLPESIKTEIVSACVARYTTLIAPADTPVTIGNWRAGARSAIAEA